MLTPITSTDYRHHKQLEETKRYPWYRKQKGSNRGNKSTTWCEKEETEENRSAEKKTEILTIDLAVERQGGSAVNQRHTIIRRQGGSAGNQRDAIVRRQVGGSAGNQSDGEIRRIGLQSKSW
jgi:hypothetical protein